MDKKYKLLKYFSNVISGDEWWDSVLQMWRSVRHTPTRATDGKKYRRAVQMERCSTSANIKYYKERKYAFDV